MYSHRSEPNMKDFGGKQIPSKQTLLIFTSSGIGAYFKWGKQHILRLLDTDPIVIKTADSKDGDCSSLYSACRWTSS